MEKVKRTKSSSTEENQLHQSTLDLEEFQKQKKETSKSNENKSEDGIIHVEQERFNQEERLDFIIKSLKIIKMFEADKSYYQHLFFCCRGCMQLFVLADTLCYKNKKVENFDICEKCYEQLFKEYQNLYDRKTLEFNPDTGFCQR